MGWCDLPPEDSAAEHSLYRWQQSQQDSLKCNLNGDKDPWKLKVYEKDKGQRCFGLPSLQTYSPFAPGPVPVPVPVPVPSLNSGPVVAFTQKKKSGFSFFWPQMIAGADLGACDVRRQDESHHSGKRKFTKQCRVSWRRQRLSEQPSKSYTRFKKLKNRIQGAKNRTKYNWCWSN